MTLKEKIEKYQQDYDIAKQICKDQPKSDDSFEAEVEDEIRDRARLALNVAKDVAMSADEFAIEFSKYVLSQIYNMTHGNKAGISIEELLEIYKKEKGL
jgi:hypothetical protein